MICLYIVFLFQSALFIEKMKKSRKKQQQGKKLKLYHRNNPLRSSQGKQAFTKIVTHVIGIIERENTSALTTNKCFTTFLVVKQLHFKSKKSILQKFQKFGEMAAWTTENQ